MPDILIIGAGHNGLVAATLLAREKYSVHVCEDKPVVGGAVRTEYPFAKAPGVGCSTGAYLLGLMPPELIQKLGIDLPLIRRDPHYFLPTTGSRYLLFGSDQECMRKQFVSFFSEADWTAHLALQDEISKIRDDIAPTWLQEPLSLNETAEKFVRPALRKVFLDLCVQPVSSYLERFGFRSNLVKAMYAVTDGFSGLTAGWDSPGTGMNFLVHNMCRLPNSDGTWMIVRGGMGTVSKTLADAARKSGAVIETNRRVERIIIENNVARGVVFSDGSELRANVVVANADPFRLQRMIGEENLPEAFNKRIDGYRKDGTTMKVNLCLNRLPKFTCLPEDRGQYSTTIHLLPDENEVIPALRKAFSEVSAGKLAEFPTIEWYTHSTIDPGMCDAQGRHTAALFVQWAPYKIAGSSWEAEESKYVKQLLSICDRFAPGTSDSVEDVFSLPPPKIEEYFGMTRGHIHHVDNSFGFSDRMPSALPISGLYSCSAGCHPAGSVIGAAGHNAAMRIISDLKKI